MLWNDSEPEFEAGVDDVERDAAEEEVGRAERRQVHLLEVRIPHAVGAQLLCETMNQYSLYRWVAPCDT